MPLMTRPRLLLRLILTELSSLLLVFAVCLISFPMPTYSPPRKNREELNNNKGNNLAQKIAYCGRAVRSWVVLYTCQQNTQGCMALYVVVAFVKAVPCVRGIAVAWPSDVVAVQIAIPVPVVLVHGCYQITAFLWSVPGARVGSVPYSLCIDL